MSHPVTDPAKLTAQGARLGSWLQGSPRGCQVCPPSPLCIRLVPLKASGGPATATAQAVVAEVGETEKTGA